MANTNDFIANVEHAASAIKKDVQAHPWEDILALTHLPFDGGASLAQVAARHHVESTNASRITVKPADHTATASARTLPNIQIDHSSDRTKSGAAHKPGSAVDHFLSGAIASVGHAANTAWHEVTTNPTIAAGFGPVGTAIYDGQQIHDYVQSHGGVSNILPGLSRVAGALSRGAADETVNHPVEMVAAGATGAVIGALARVPYVNGVVATLGVAYIGYEIYKHGGEWVHDADVTYYQQGHSAAELANAQTGLQHDGAGLALMGAGGIGAGLGASAADSVVAMATRSAVTETAATGTTEATAETTAAAAGSRAAAGLAAPGRSAAPEIPAQISHGANDNHAILQVRAANENHAMLEQARAVNDGRTSASWTTGDTHASDTRMETGTGTGSGTGESVNWAEAKAGNANQDRFSTPEDRTIANQAARNAANANEWAALQNFKDLGLGDLARGKGEGNYGERVEETLAQIKIHSTAELQARSEQDLLKLPGMTTRSVGLIKEALANKGLHLRPDALPSEIESFQFSDQSAANANTVRALAGQGITNFETLAERYNDGSLRNIPSIGDKALAGIKQALNKNGFATIEPAAPAAPFDGVAFADQQTTNTRIVNALEKKGINNFDRLAESYNDGSIQNVIGIGGKALESIRQALIQKGYHVI